jgi:hypothetical protein
MFATRLCLKAWKPTWGSFFAVTGRSQFRLTLFGKICTPAILLNKSVGCPPWPSATYTGWPLLCLNVSRTF